MSTFLLMSISVWQVAKPYKSKYLVSRWHNGKESTCQCRRCKRQGSAPGSRRSLGGGNSNLLQYSCLGNPMARGTWWTIVHRSPKSWTWLSTHTSIVTMMMMMMFKTKLSSSQQKMLLLTFLSWLSQKETSLPHSCICLPPHISVVIVVFNVILPVFLHVYHLYLPHCHPLLFRALLPHFSLGCCNSSLSQL